MKTGGIANPPNLKEGMIPVKWDSTNRTWVKADETNTNRDWYDYSTGSKKWANIVTVKENGTGTNGTTRQQYMQAEVGTPILEEDITTMFVWIPRYSYKITSGHHKVANKTNSTGDAKIDGEIKIEFLLGQGDNFVSGTGKAERTSITNGNDFIVHPAFTANTSLGGSGKEITGFWVGKFESSNSTATYDNQDLTQSSTPAKLYGGGNTTDLSVTIRPNVTSWRAIEVSNIFTVCQAMNADRNIHGLESDTVTTMMQNSQWGAVAYLAQSDYGNKQTLADSTSGIWINPYNEGYTYATTDNSYKMWSYATILTGMAGSSRDTSSNYYSKVQSKTKNDEDSVTISYLNINSDGNPGTTYTNTYYRYYTENGQKASTTRNIYGICDMSGGAWEYMASYLENGTTDALQSFKNLKIDEKYQTSYKGTGADDNTTDRTANYNANQHMYGDALWETSNGASGQYSWNDDYSYFPFLPSPFFIRGGSFGSGAGAGLFSFSYFSGSNYYNNVRVPCGGTLKCSLDKAFRKNSKRISCYFLEC